MDLAFDQLARSTRSQDVAEATRANEYRRIALERRAQDAATPEGSRSPWTRLARVLMPHRTHRDGGLVAASGRP